MHHRFPAETDSHGNVEYKLHLLDPSPGRLVHLRTQMMWRVAEGGGRAIYRVGVRDDGYAVGLPWPQLESSLHCLEHDLAGPLGLCVDGEDKDEGFRPGSKPWLYYASVVVSKKRKMAPPLPPRQIRVAVVGAAGGGKSSLIATLVHHSSPVVLRDDGKGKARRFVAQHKHELNQGRTSSFSLHVLPPVSSSSSKEQSGLGASVVDVFNRRRIAWEVEGAGEEDSKVVLIDTPGEERFLFTTLRAIAALQPDCLLVCEQRDAEPTTFFADLGRAMRLPVMIVGTQYDDDHDDDSSSLLTSAVTGRGLAELIARLHAMDKEVMVKEDLASSPAVLTVRQRFSPFLGDDDDDDEDDDQPPCTVVCGLVQRGVFRVGDQVRLLPLCHQNEEPVIHEATVTSLRCSAVKNKDVGNVRMVGGRTAAGMALDLLQHTTTCDVAAVVSSTCPPPVYASTLHIALLHSFDDDDDLSGVVVFSGAAVLRATCVRAENNALRILLPRQVCLAALANPVLLVNHHRRILVGRLVVP